MSLYNLRSLTADTYMICKFDDDFSVESTYTLTAKGFSYTCDCPANNRAVVTKPCRHKLMMPTLLPHVDTDRFYDHDTGKFCSPLGDLIRPEAAPEVSVSGFKAEVEIVGEALHDPTPSEALRDLTNAMDEALGSSSLVGEAVPSSSIDRDVAVGNTRYDPKAVPASPSAPIIRRR
jgi:hypothetical protein